MSKPFSFYMIDSAQDGLIAWTLDRRLVGHAMRYRGCLIIGVIAGIIF